jgi:DNA-binding NarL/FixJ family response regulator
LRAVIADDSVLLREGISRLLAEGGIEVAAGVGDADALLQEIENEQPDLAIIDVRMPPAHRDEGLRAAIEIRRRWPGVALLVLSQFVEERYATELIAGDTRALGYLLKDRVADVVRQLLARTRRRDPLAQLTPKEREVLGLMAEGRSNAAIAEALVVTLGAVEKHVASIFMKLDLPADDDQRHRRVAAVVQYLGG